MSEPTDGSPSGPGRRRGSGRERGRRGTPWLAPALLTALPLAALSLFRAVPAEWPAEVEQLLAFTPWLVLPAGAGLLSAVLSRRAWLQAVAVALLAVQLLWLFPPDRVPSGYNAGGTPGAVTHSAGTVRLKVMNLNARLGGADPSEIVRLVRENGIGLLAIQEHTRALQDHLAAAGLSGLLPHRISRPVDGAAGSALYSLHPMRPLGTLPDTQFHMPTVRLDLSTGSPAAAGQPAGEPASLDVTNVHAQPPVSGRIDRWRSDLAAIGRLTGSPGNLLLIGDFNATYDHSEFRQLLQGGSGGRPLVDVGLAEGARLVPTWPMDGQLLPGVVIDHLLISPQLHASAYSVHRVAGTDHAAIMATLAVPAPG